MIVKLINRELFSHRVLCLDSVAHTVHSCYLMQESVALWRLMWGCSDIEVMRAAVPALSRHQAAYGPREISFHCFPPKYVIDIVISKTTWIWRHKIYLPLPALDANIHRAKRHFELIFRCVCRLNA